jgi:hypothetical protein
MPNNEPIRGDDAAWKRKVDQTLINLQQQIDALKNQIKYLQKRVK